MIPIKIVKRSLHIPNDVTDDDKMLSVYLSAAISAAEKYTGIVINQRCFAEYYDCFPNKIITSKPLLSVQEINYFDTQGNMHLLDAENYSVITGSIYSEKLPIDSSLIIEDHENIFGYVEPVTGTEWPDVQNDGTRNVNIQYLSGFTYNTLPEDIKIALLTRVGQLYNDREATSVMQVNEVPMTYHSLLDHYRGLMIYSE